MTRRAVFHDTGDDSYDDGVNSLTIGDGTPSGTAGGVLDGTYPNPGIAAGVAGAGLAETTNVLSVNVDGSTIEINTDTLRVKADGITANEIAAGAVGASELASTAVSASTYGDATHVGQFTVDQDGRLTAASSVTITGAAPTGSAGGVLDGTFPNPGLAAGVAGAGLAETSDVLSVNVDGSTIEINADTLRVKAGGIGANEIASTAVTAASYGDATHVGQFTVDADGRLTAASSVAITASGGGITTYDYVTQATPLAVSATTAATANTFITGNAVTYDGSTLIRVEFFSPLSDSTQFLAIDLWDGSSDLGEITQQNGLVVGLYGSMFLTPSAAAHTFTIRAWRGTGSANISPGAGGAGTRIPAWMRITKA